MTTHDSSSSASTSSLNDGTLTNSASTITNDQRVQTFPITSSRALPTRSTSATRVTTKASNESTEEKPSSTLSRPNAHQFVKRHRRLMPGKNPRRLLQYELLPTGKVYYVNRSAANQSDRRHKQIEYDENSSVDLSTILSRSSSLDTLSDKRYRHRQTQKYPADATLKKNDGQVTVGGRLASNHNLSSATASPFKPIHGNKKRFSSFEPTPESLDRMLDVLVAADKRREEHEFWKEKFDPRATTSRPTMTPLHRHPESGSTNTIPIVRSKQVPPTPTSTNSLRSQSYTQRRTPVSDSPNRAPGGGLLEECLRKRVLLVNQQQQQAERNYSPNTIYSTTYPKSQLPPTGKPPLPPGATTTTSATTAQPVRILPTSNGRLTRAPQAKQTSDELSSTSDVWATRSSFEENNGILKKSTLSQPSSTSARYPSNMSRSRTGVGPGDGKLSNSKRASSMDQPKTDRTGTPTQKNSSHKSKFFDLFKFNR